MASGIMDPPKWDQKMKDFGLWIREVKAWKVATNFYQSYSTQLKRYYGLPMMYKLNDKVHFGHA